MSLAKVFINNLWIPDTGCIFLQWPCDGKVGIYMYLDINVTFTQVVTKSLEPC